jgi:hypothetical protein
MTAYSHKPTKVAINPIDCWEQYVGHFNQGYGYLHQSQFVQIYGETAGLWPLCRKYAVIQESAGLTTQEWLRLSFAAESLQAMSNPPGEIVARVWRPGLDSLDGIETILDYSTHERSSAENALRSLLQKLEEILLFIEPTQVGMSSYGHKTRELLILVCTEVENYWVNYLKCANVLKDRYTTKDYVRLQKRLFLSEYVVDFKMASNGVFKPFESWDSNSPSKSLGWYEAYNQTKHDRLANFTCATLKNCLEAVSALIIMFSVRYSPYVLLRGLGNTASIFNQYFSIELKNPNVASFYIPLITRIGSGCANVLRREDVSTDTEQWISKSFVL